MAGQLIASAVADDTRSSDFVDGARAITPMIVGVVPFGLAIGAVAASGTLPTAVGWSGSVFLLGGSAQLTILQSLAGGASTAVALGAALLVNARLLVYGAGMSGWFPTTGIRGRLLLALPLVDQLYLTATNDFGSSPRTEAGRRRFYAGAAISLWLAFIAAQSIGALVGNGVPSWLGLEAASPIALSGLLAGAVSSRGTTYAAAAAAIVIAATSSFDAPVFLVVAILVGIAVGWRPATTAEASR